MVPDASAHAVPGPERRRVRARRGGTSASERSEPLLGEVLRRARNYRGYSLRQVQDRTGVLGAHLSQIERGQIRRPDPSLLWRLSELYSLDYGLLAQWAGHAHSDDGKTARLSAAVRLLVNLTSDQVDEVLRTIERMRREAGEATPPSDKPRTT
jgi:transcriptional regulator with XRE-family HTH domain